MTSEAYKFIVKEAKEHIVLLEPTHSKFNVNPSPYLTYLQVRGNRGCILVASSPEILMSAKKKRIVNRPLAGAARRGKSGRGQTDGSSASAG
ncbi:hypothetical protein ACLB2K_027166 [Fragaria x ananassa]